eukprot:1832-Heterococcus_DN1.PRE.2
MYTYVQVYTRQACFPSAAWGAPTLTMQLQWWIATTVFCIFAARLQDMECARIQRLRHALATKAGSDLPVLAVAAVVGALALLAVLAAVLLACPSGAAWADKATADNIAHAPLTECSSFGYCNRATGVCECKDGYSGEACQRKLCPGNGNCSGHGRCIS